MVKKKAPKKRTATVRSKAEWTTAEWNGHPQFVCAYCRFDVLDDVEKMKRHIEDVHRGKQAASAQSLPAKVDDVFEVELKEIDSTVDPDGNVHKTYTVKE